jgi:NAD(P)-dependent dehydrogenase (short-subunit alcohol dehydrogenase family)
VVPVPERAVVMTGGTSGFGALAARRLVAQPDVRLLLGSRGTPGPDGAHEAPLDLESLDAVRSFAAAAIRWSAGRIDALVLNAGVLRPDAAGRTADGFETTFAVNHLAHHLLLRLLLGALAPGAVVVLTTSGTHDPDEGAGLPAPRHADAHRLAYPEQDPAVAGDRPAVAGRRAYTASKLCAVLTVRALADAAWGRGVVPVAFCPGQTGGTGLVRSMPLPLRAGWRVLGGPLGVLKPGVNRRADAGRALAALALGTLRPPTGEYYGALRRGRVVWKQPAVLARRDDVMRALWRDSAALVGPDDPAGCP